MLAMLAGQALAQRIAPNALGKRSYLRRFLSRSVNIDRLIYTDSKQKVQTALPITWKWRVMRWMRENSTL